MAEAAAEVDRFAGAIGGPVGVDVAAVGQSAGDAHALQIDDVGGHLPSADGEDANVAGVLAVPCRTSAARRRAGLPPRRRPARPLDMSSFTPGQGLPVSMFSANTKTSSRNS